MEWHGNTDEKVTHAWNYVYHDDEKKWYAVDITWDNNKNKNEATSYSYFMIGNNTAIKYNSGTYLFSQNHIVGHKNYKSQTYIPSAPVLSDDAYEKFSGKIRKSTTKKTNQPVIVTATFNRELKEIPSGWTLSDDKMSITKTYYENINEKHKIVNVRGERLNATINITNIDKVAPEAMVTYSINNITNQNVEVTITANEEIQGITGWTLSNDNKTLTKTYESNAQETIVVKDLAGNTTNTKISINNIDKTNPLITGVENGKNYKDSVILNATDNNLGTLLLTKNGEKVEGYTNGKEIIKEGSYRLTATDMAGNTTVVEFTIEYNRGDLNVNNNIDTGDILALLRHIAQENSTKVAQKHPEWSLDDKKQIIADANRNGKVDIADVLKLQRYIAAKSSDKISEKHPGWLVI